MADMDDELILRLAKPAERSELEALQRRASLMWEEDRAKLLAALRAYPNFIEIPPEQIAGGRVFIAERKGKLMGFGVVLRRDDGQAELDGLFVEPDHWRQGIGSRWYEKPNVSQSATGLRLCMSSPTDKPKTFTLPTALI